MTIDYDAVIEEARRNLKFAKVEEERLCENIKFDEGMLNSRKAEHRRSLDLIGDLRQTIRILLQMRDSKMPKF